MGTSWKPACGTYLGPDSTLIKKVTSALLTVLAAVTGAAGAASLIKGTVLAHATLSEYAAAVAAFAVVEYSIYTIMQAKCSPRPGKEHCSSGVVQDVIPAFSDSPSDDFFPYAANHDRVDVVVKSEYWSLVAGLTDGITSGINVICNQDSDQSPIMPGFYKNPKVCAAGVGAMIGAIPGALIGLAIGLLLATGFACGPLAFACWLAVLIIIAFCVAVFALIGAAIGGVIAASITPASGPSATGGGRVYPISQGDFVSTVGNTTPVDDASNALTFWFVTSTSLYGNTGAIDYYSYHLPDSVLADAWDVCQKSPWVKTTQ